MSFVSYVDVFFAVCVLLCRCNSGILIFLVSSIVGKANAATVEMMKN